MGIGGAVLYSLAYVAVRGLVSVGALVARSLRSAGHALFAGAASHRAILTDGQWFHDPLWGNLHAWRSQRQMDGSATGD